MFAEMINETEKDDTGKLLSMKQIIKQQIVNKQTKCIPHGTIHTSFATLSRGIPWNMPRVTRIFSVYTRAFRPVFIPRNTNDKSESAAKLFSTMPYNIQ